MRADAIDHVTLRIPESRIDDAVDFYEGKLGFETEQLQHYESGEQSIFTFRLGEGCVIHAAPVPADDFSPPDGSDFRHLALRVDRSIDALEAALDEAGVEIVSEGHPLGATGAAPAVYVEDPFGYAIELKARPED